MKTSWMAGKVKVRGKGDSLLPNGLLNRNFLRRMRKVSGSYYYQALYQGDPVAKGSNYFDEEYFKYYKVIPMDRKYSIITIDAAQEAKKSSDFTVFQYWIETEKGYYLKDTLRKKLKFLQLQENSKLFYNKHRANKVLIEPKSNGAALFDYLKNTTKIPVEKVDSKFLRFSKQERANQILGQFEAGNIYFPEDAVWLWDLIKELVDFDRGDYDDQVDALVYAIYYLAFRKKSFSFRSLG